MRVLALSVAAAVALAGLTPASAIRCVFMHGSGQDKVGPPTSTDTDKYWGDMAKYTSGHCTSYVYNHDDTVNQAFDDEALVASYCKTMSGGTGIIRDSIVYTHSMGNMVMAAALRDNACKLDSSSKWFAVSAPFAGSKAANFVDNICAQNSTIDEALRKVAALLHYCRSDDPTMPARAYLSMKTSYPGLSGLMATARQFVSGALCGTSPFGLTSLYSIPMEALSDLVKYGEPDDGMVGLDSCVIPGKQYGDSYEDTFFKAAVNHPDGTCRDGNGDFGMGARQPCKWFTYAK